MLTKDHSKKFSYLDSRILVADDSTLNHELIISYLRHAGFRHLDSARDGEEALTKAFQGKPDLIILNLVMPKLDGIQIIKNLRSRKETHQLPIIVQTTLTTPGEHAEAWQFGATDVVTKPINRMELLSRVRVQLENNFLIKELEEYHTIAQQDIDQALEVQKSLLPTHDFIKDLSTQYGVEIDSLYVPSRFLSGDMWGLIPVSPHLLGVWISDFSGKGIKASLNTFRFHTLIQEYKKFAHDPIQFIEILNNRLKEMVAIGQFSTFLFGLIDTTSNLFTYVSASGPHPLIYFPQERKFLSGDGTGFPLGVSENSSYEIRTLPLPIGSSLVLYSDLFWEEYSLPGISLSNEKLDNLALDLEGRSLVKTFKEIMEQLGETNFSDDLTVVEITHTKDMSKK